MRRGTSPWGSEGGLGARVDGSARRSVACSGEWGWIDGDGLAQPCGEDLDGGACSGEDELDGVAARRRLGAERGGGGLEVAAGFGSRGLEQGLGAEGEFEVGEGFERVCLVDGGRGGARGAGLVRRAAERAGGEE